MKIDKGNSDLLKGIAILMMLTHHFWNPTLQPIPATINVYGHIFISPEALLSAFCKVCVSLFAFLSGWVAYLQSDKLISYGYIFKKIKTFLFEYWIIAIFFLIIGYYLNIKLPTFNIFIANIFGFEVGVQEIMGCDYINVTMAWYVRFYMSLLLTFPILMFFLKKLSRYNGAISLCLIIIFMALIRILCSYIDCYIVKKVIALYFEWTPSVIVGYYCCQYKWLDYIYNKLNFSVALLVLIGIVAMRSIIRLPYSLNVDYLYVIFIVVVTIKYTPRIIIRYMQQLGTISMFIWYIHSIFFIPTRPLSNLITFAGNSFTLLFLGIFWSVLFTIIYVLTKKYTIAIINKKRR